ncbi:MAG: hypothetical protein H5T96_09685, partial [Tissierellales bacterium]|nr:hypothetical protein [Tissierellales bacterium]
MASFTDRPITFTPYVQQLPVEQMYQVGATKQNLYNQGLQRIQSQIDSVAGLDVARDVDKAYLESKMNSLGNSLKLVAAGDFSDFQLVNSVRGMINQVGNDENIKNAVASTHNYRQGLMDMQAAIKEGKSSPSNEWDFQTRAAEWLNSGDIKQTFSGGYHPYTDYRGKLLDAIKQLKPDVNATDLSFTTNSKGELVPTDATTRQKLSGIPPEKMQQAVMSVMTPSDWRQMEIDGRYSYANIPPEAFAQSVTESYSEKYDAFTDQRDKLKNALNSTTSAGEKANLVRQIADIDKTINGLVSEYSNIAETFTKGDVESAKARLYTTNFINGFSKAFSYTEAENTQETNPNAVIAMQREVKNQDWKKFIITEERLWKQFDLDREKLAFEKQKEANKLLGEGGTGGGLGSVTMREDVPEITKGTFTDKLAQDSGQLAGSDAAFIKKKGKDEQWFEQQLEAYTRGGGDSDVVEYFNNTAELRRKVNSNYSVLKDINQKMEQKYGSIYDNIPTNSSPAIIINDGGRGSTKFNPREIVDFNLALNKITSSIPGQVY